MINDTLYHKPNHFYDLMLELQEAKRHGHISGLRLLEHNLLVFMNNKTCATKLREVSEYITKKYKVYSEHSITAKTIIIYEAYILTQV